MPQQRDIFDRVIQYYALGAPDLLSDKHGYAKEMPVLQALCLAKTLLRMSKYNLSIGFTLPHSVSHLW